MVRNSGVLPTIIAFLLAATSLNAGADGVRVMKDIDYIPNTDYSDDKDKLDLYLPEGANGFPIVVYFHGGGLRAGDKSGSGHVGQALAASGIGAAIANYRLSPTVEHPKHAQDAAASSAWVYEHIGDYGGDPKKLYVSGHSAGGYLSGLLAVDARYLKGAGLPEDALKGAMPISGFFYVDRVAKERPKDVWGTDERVWREASAWPYARADAPPILFLYAEGDDAWRKKDIEDMATTLKSKGHPTISTVEIENRDHRGIAAQISDGDPTLRKLADFVTNP